MAIPYTVPMVDRLLYAGCVEGEFAPEKFVFVSCDTINRLDANYSHDQLFVKAVAACHVMYVAKATLQVWLRVHC